MPGEPLVRTELHTVQITDRQFDIVHLSQGEGPSTFFHGRVHHGLMKDHAFLIADSQVRSSSFEERPPNIRPRHGRLKRLIIAHTSEFITSLRRCLITRLRYGQPLHRRQSNFGARLGRPVLALVTQSQ